jgi:hypothetical protein
MESVRFSKLAGLLMNLHEYILSQVFGRCGVEPAKQKIPAQTHTIGFEQSTKRLVRPVTQKGFDDLFFFHFTPSPARAARRTIAA